MQKLNVRSLYLITTIIFSVFSFNCVALAGLLSQTSLLSELTQDKTTTNKIKVLKQRIINQRLLIKKTVAAIEELQAKRPKKPQLHRSSQPKAEEIYLEKLAEYKLLLDKHNSKRKLLFAMLRKFTSKLTAMERQFNILLNKNNDLVADRV